jgi:cysteine desulfurase
MSMIYFDHSATTPTDPRVVAKMLPYWTEHFGNPSSLHNIGKAAADALHTARITIAGVLNCEPDELVFTSGGTESNNLALRGVAHALRQRGRGKHIITSAVEHHAVLDVVKVLETDGFDITVLPVDQYGRVNVEQVATALREDTILVSLLYANNEVGTVNPIAEIGAMLKARRVRFHVDAVQAVGLLSLDVNALGVDLMSLSAHKFYGPKGAGLLYVRRATPLVAQMVGGGQQEYRRSGTESVPLIVGMAEALRLAEAERTASVAKLTALRDYLINAIVATLPVTLTGHPTERLAGHTSFTLHGLNGDAILLDLNEMGFAASGGSACTTGEQEPSHVLIAMGIHPDLLMGQVRFVLGKANTQQQIDAFLHHLRAIVARYGVQLQHV